MEDKAMKIRFLATRIGGLLVCLAFAARLVSRQSAFSETSTTSAIRAVLTAQQSAWNRGDVETFMKGYWNSPDLTFAGSSGVTRGWETVMERYRRNYPDVAAMGHLDFSQVEIHVLGNDAALVLGRWHLKRANDEPGGFFTLVFQRFPEGWRIIHDHTSAETKP
jgi:uncharacterized protein (TIGR02246 family)